jgi:protein gp37
MKKPQVIFVCSMADLFGDWVPVEWIEQVIGSCVAAPQHTYIFLTKNPDRMKEFFRDKRVQKNFWLGTSCGENKMSWERVFTIMEIDIWGWNTLVSAEPLKTSNLFAYETGEWFDWMIIGMQTNPLVPCDPWVIANTIEPMVEVGIPVFMKDSVKACFPEITMHREYPTGMRDVS